MHGVIRRAASSTMMLYAVNNTWVYNEPWAVTTCPEWHNWTTEAYYYEPIPTPPPKNWRWFGVFRRAVELPLAVAQVQLLTPLQRRLGFLSLAARRRQKRRRFLQVLRAAT